MINQAGALREKIKIYMPPDDGDFSKNAHGEFVVSMYAKKLDLSEKQFFASRQDNYSSTKKFLVRYNKIVKQGMRVEYQDEIFTIEEVLNEDVNSIKTWMFIMAGVNRDAC